MKLLILNLVLEFQVRSKASIDLILSKDTVRNLNCPTDYKRKPKQRLLGNRR